MRRTHDIDAHVARMYYPEIVSATARISECFGVILRSRKVRMKEPGARVFTALEPFLLDTESVAAWPGTEMFGGRMSTRYVYAVNPVTVDIVLRAATSFFDWVNPDLPEDLHFMRSDSSPTLACVAQEDDVWLEVDDAELVQWRSEVPVSIADAVLSARSE